MEEFLRHLRSIHFIMVVTAFGVLATQFFDRQSEAYIAHQQFNQIMKDLKHWDEYLLSKVADDLINNGKFDKNAMIGSYSIEFTFNKSGKKTKKNITIQPIFYTKKQIGLLESWYNKQRDAPKGASELNYRLIDIFESPKPSEIFKMPTSLQNLENKIPFFIEGIWAIIPTKIHSLAYLSQIGMPSMFGYIKVPEGAQTASVSYDPIDELVDSKKVSLQNYWIKMLGERNQQWFRDVFRDKKFKSLYILETTFIEELTNSRVYVYQPSIPIDITKVDIDILKLIEDHMGINWHYLPLNDSFPELMNIAKEFKDEKFVTVKKFLNSEKRRSSNELEAFGIKIPATDVSIWGLAVLLLLQIYFLIHYRQFKKLFSLSPRTESLDFPWIGTYENICAKCLFALSVALLPISTHAIIIYRGLFARGFGHLECIALGFGIGGLFVAIITIYMRVSKKEDANLAHIE